MSTSHLVSQSIIDYAQSQINVKSKASRDSQNWWIELSISSGQPSGDLRLRLATRLLIELDAIIGDRLQRGHTVNFKGTFLPTQTNGPHAVAELISPLLLPRKIPQQNQLYSYQVEGADWLINRERALLCDDMGLGKTAQALSAARRLIREGEVSWVLIIVPRTLVANWMTEIRLWAPELTIASALPNVQHRINCWRKLVRRSHFIVTNYEQLCNRVEPLYQHPPDLIIADEAHRLRKLESRTTQGIKALKSKRFWALTGTPVERDSEDLAVLMSIIDPYRFSPDDKFLHHSSLRARVRPYLLRRTRDDVLKELPPVVESNEKLELTPSQREIYDRSVASGRKGIKISNYLPLFNLLRSICDFDDRNGSSSKLDRAMEIISDIADSNEKVVVFSYLIPPLNWLEKRMKIETPLIGSIKLTGKSSLNARKEILEDFKKSSKVSVLLASTRVASEGLTLVEANHVIFINRWWNPSSNNQARDRVVRIGQFRTVYVKSFSCQGTVEERLDSLLERKKMTFEKLIDSLKKSPSSDIVNEILR